MTKSLDFFRERSRQIIHLRGVAQGLSWDQETMMPPEGAEHRAAHLSTLAVLQHERLVDPAFGAAVEALRSDDDLQPEDRAAVAEAKRQVDRATKLPPRLVAELAEHAVLCYEAWVKARKASDFQAFAPWLARMAELKRQEARCLVDSGSPYNALLDDYEPGMTTTELDSLFGRLRPALSRLLASIQQRSAQPAGLPPGPFPRTIQEEIGKQVITAMGFDWNAGRLDVSAHPFCAGFSPRDVRITVRYFEDQFAPSFFGMIHEAGHALYEQGLNPTRYGNFDCEAISLGIHESQSRLWENQVARSRPFWSYWLPHLQKAFEPVLADVSLDEFLRAVNRVRPSLIRVEADEVSYGLHVILRYELEKQLMEDNLPATDLNEAWNARMEDYLGIRPESAANGVLQDIHWSQGLFGYFPTYLLGNLYAAQLFRQAGQSIPDLEERISTGDLRTLREWLRDNVHRLGKTVGAAELIQRVSGESLNPDYFLQYLEQKNR